MRLQSSGSTNNGELEGPDSMPDGPKTRTSLTPVISNALILPDLNGPDWSLGWEAVSRHHRSGRTRRTLEGKQVTVLVKRCTIEEHREFAD